MVAAVSARKKQPEPGDRNKSRCCMFNQFSSVDKRNFIKFEIKKEWKSRFCHHLIDLWRFVASTISAFREKIIRNSPLERPWELPSKCRVVFIMPCHLGVCVDKFLDERKSVRKVMEGLTSRSFRRFYEKHKNVSFMRHETNKTTVSVGRRRIADDAVEKKQS